MDGGTLNAMTAPSATGTLAATPLAHALIYARNRRLTGRLELTAPTSTPGAQERSAVVTLWRGMITAVETTPVGLCPGGYFGAIVYELGYIESSMLDATLLEIAKTKRLHGEILIERKAITPAQRDEALVEQVHRKIHHLFSFPDETKYAFYDAKVALVEPPVAVDPVGPVWRGVRDYPPQKFVEETVRRVGDHALRATGGGSARLPPSEASLARAVSHKPMTIAEMKASTDLPPSRVELLVYLLVIAKCVESVDGARTHPSTGALPVSMPSGPVRPPSGETIKTRRDSGPVRLATPLTPGRPISSPRLPAVPGSQPRMNAILTPKSQPRIPITAAPSSSSRLAAAVAAVRTPAELGLDGIALRAETVENESYFEVLGVAEGASAEAVRANYIRLAKTWHPDRLVVDFHPVRAEVAKIFAHMSNAQKTLCDPDARRNYVAARNAKAAARPREEVMREVERALQLQNWEAVNVLCQTLIDANADDAEALALQVWSSLRGAEGSTEDDLRAALTRIDRAVNVDRTNDQAVYYRGLIHKRLNNVPAAFRDFARAVQLNPKHLDAEREVRIFAMRARKGSGEHKMIAPLIEKVEKATGKK